MRETQIDKIKVGFGHRPLLIAGPCVIESRELSMQIAGKLFKISQTLDVPFVFKASFDKANRTSGKSFRGVGIDCGLRILEEVHQAFGVPVTTDIHLPEQAVPAAEVCALLQIPAFLARQTDLLVASAKTGRAINVKKGQFMAPHDMQYVLDKVRETGNENVLLCERGTFFGYGRLVNDMQAIPVMQSLGAPVIFDATHSVQQPGGLGGATGGNRSMVEPLARAAAALNVNGFFFEVHPDPNSSPSDGPNMIFLDQFESVLGRVLKVWETADAMRT